MLSISGMLYCILSGQEHSGGEVVVQWRESLLGFSHPAVHLDVLTLEAYPEHGSEGTGRSRDWLVLIHD